MSGWRSDMRILLVGGHTRNIGKTALVVDLIRAFPESGWTAVKITQYGHGVCSINGEECECAPDQHTFALDEESDRNNRTDTSRFLVAGAARALWLRAKQGWLAEALPLLRETLSAARLVIIESNTLLEFLRPELCLLVLDPRQSDFKDSARRYLDRADAFVLRAPLAAVAWVGSAARGAGARELIPRRVIERNRCFLQPLGASLPPDLVRFVGERYFGGTGLSL